MTRTFIASVLLAVSLGQAVSATPLDDRVAAFNDPASTQAEAQVAQLLELGLRENRSAEALAAVQAWLNRNNLSDPIALYNAGQVAERSGQWLAAVGYYQRLLQTPKPDAKLAGPAVDSVYRLLLGALRDENTAYLYMRKDGNRVRSFGQASRYDRWFLDQAKKRRDLIAVTERLAAIVADNKSKPDRFSADFEWLCTELEHFRKEDPSVYDAAAMLAAAARTPVLVKARLNWAATVIPYNIKLDELRNANAPADPKLTDAPLAAAEALLKADPDHGAIAVAKGWGTEYDGHHGTCAARFQVEGQRKLMQLLAVVPKMSPDKRDDLLAYPIARGRVRFDVMDIWALILKHPESFNGFDVARVPMFDKAKLTIDQAKQLAPHLARNPHPEAAMIRAIAASSSLEVSKIAEAMLKTEAWRFVKNEDAVNTAWHTATTHDVEHKVLITQYKKPDPRFVQLSRQVTKKAGVQDQVSAFNTLYKDLLSDAPSIPAALQLWDELFTNASDAADVQMIKAMVADTSGHRTMLLRRALGKARFGKKNGGSMLWEGQVYGNQFRYHRQPVQVAVPELILHLQGHYCQAGPDRHDR